MALPSPWPESLVLFGAGRMGQVMLEAWLKEGALGKGIYVVEPNPSRALQDLCRSYQIHLAAQPPARPAQVYVLAIKPQIYPQILSSLSFSASSPDLICSIMAGISLSTLAYAAPPHTSIVRAMPNTPARIGKGVTALVTSSPQNASACSMAETLVRSLGTFFWLEEEALMDSVTALSGSGPAYVFYFAESLKKAGISLGLPEALAENLARQTLAGSSDLLREENQKSLSDLRKEVTSPGGTTEAALTILMAPEALEDLLHRTLSAARERAKYLSSLPIAPPVENEVQEYPNRK